jgi:hypothetical protein
MRPLIILGMRVDLNIPFQHDFAVSGAKAYQLDAPIPLIVSGGVRPSERCDAGWAASSFSSRNAPGSPERIDNKVTNRFKY